jgi:hypothetical protein
MPCDSAGVAFVRTGAHDLADLLDHVPELVVRGEVVRADPNAGTGPEVAEDLPLAELGVHGLEVRHVHRHRPSATKRVTRAADLEPGCVGELDQQIGLTQ